MNTAQLIFMSVMSGLIVLVVVALVLTDLADRLPTDPYGRITQNRRG